MLVSEWVVIRGYMVRYGWVGLCPLVEHLLCKRRHEKCFLPKFMVSNLFCVLLEMIKLNQWSMGSCQQSTCIIGHVHSLKLINSKFFLLKIGLKPQKGKDRLPTIHFQVRLLLVSGRVWFAMEAPEVLNCEDTGFRWFTMWWFQWKCGGFCWVPIPF